MISLYKTLFLYLFLVSSSFAQSPVASFSFREEVCFNENIDFSNTSSDAAYFEWDFCIGDFNEEHELSFINFDDLNISRSRGFQILSEGNKKFIFVLDGNAASRLYRADASSYLLSGSESFTSVNSLEGQLTQSEGLTFVKDSEGVWVAYIGHLAQSYGVVRAKFGNGLDQEPTEIQNIGVPVGSGRTRGLKAIKENNRYYLISSAYNSNRITVIDLGNNPFSTIEESSRNISSSSSELSLPTGIDAIKYNGDWIIFVVSRSNSKIIRFNYGSSLMNSPVVEAEYDLGLIAAMEAKIIREGDNYFIVIGSETTAISIVDLGNLDKDYDVKKIDYQDPLPTAFSFALVDSASVKSVVTAQSKNINYYQFDRNCGSSIKYSEENSPIISYAFPGNYAVSLTAFDINSDFSSLIKTITVSNTEAPSGDINSADNYCSTSLMDFTFSTDEIIDTYSWNFGDNSPTASGQEVTHQYTNPGTYEVTLEVQSENGCGNRLTKEITIYEPPAPGFTAPSGQICTNGAVNFVNTTDTKGADSLITYQWLVDGELVSEEENPAITFAEGGSHTVRLEAGIPGCTEVTEQTVNVQQGPTVGFAVPQVCEGAPVAFENLTSGEDITGYQWDFGDGGTFSSTTAESPTYAFEAAGTYEVALSVSNQAGCLNTYRQEVVVYQQPSVGFLSEVACVGTPTQFTDTTTAGANANIIAWQWDFGDGNTAAVKNPAHVYQQPGTYTVRLTAQSTAGCEASVEQSIIVESPVAADFLVDRSCPTEEAPYLVQLTDGSTVLEGEEVTQWFWTIEGQTFTTPNVTYAFREPGRYEVSLTAFASSACNATVTKTIQVDPWPTVAFTYENACVGSPLAFESEVSMTGGDTSGEIISGYTWSFGEAGTALEANPTFVFEAAGTYEVRLTVQTESGCTFTTSQPVTIGEAPVAEFTASSTFGGAPLTVTFTHPVDAATQYRWDFGGPGTSSEVNPTFTFTELGTYPVTLTATNAAGCIDTFSQTITVVEPVQDVQLTDLEVLDGPGGTQQLVLTLQNAGTLLVPGLSVTVDLDDAASVQALVDEPLLPGQTLRYPLSFQLPVPVPNQSNAVRYVCARVAVQDTDFTETDLDNNRACVSLNQQLSVEAPFPNPATEEVQLSLILPQASPVALRLIDIQGQVIRRQTVAETQPGLNAFLIPVRGLPVGSYILQVVYRDEEQRFRVAVGP